jgi:DNA-binding CsgD family transcriptional regulator/PAS domain-containing protein
MAGEIAPAAARITAPTFAANELEWTALSEVIGSIYECAIDPNRWDDTIARIVSLLSPADWDVALLVWEGVSPPTGRFVGAAGVAPVAREMYAATFAGRTPWARRLVFLPTGRVVDTDEIMPRSEHTESVFYKSFLGTWGMDLAVAVVLDRRGPERLALLLAGPSDRDLSVLKRGLRLLAPHLQRAVRISHSLGEANLRAEAAESALDNAPMAVVTLTTDLTVVNANAKAAAMLKAGVIGIVDGRFSFTDRTGQARLSALARMTPPATAAFKVATPDRRELAVLGARMSALTARTLTGSIDGASMVLSIGVGGRAPLIEVDRLGAWYGLTPSEGRLAAALCAGTSLQEHALLRSVSLNAIKFLLKGVYRKTGAKTQAELVGLLKELPPG